MRIITHSEVASVIGLALSGDGRQVAASTTLRFVGVWDTFTGDVLASRREPLGITARLLYQPDNRTLIVTRPDQTLRTWRPLGTNLVEIGAFGGHLAGVGALASSPNRARLPTGDNLGVVKLWDASRLDRGVERMDARDVVPWHMNQLQFLSDHCTLVAWGRGDDLSSVLSFWDLSTQQWPFDLRGHTDFINWVCFAPDGQTLASASADRTLKLWSAQTGQKLLSLPQVAEVFQTAFSGQGHHDAGGREGGHLVPAHHLLEPVKLTGRPGRDRFVVQVPLQVSSQTVGGVVTPLTVLLQALHHDPVQVALEQRNCLFHS
jgi:WD40 repeat protein